MRKNISRILYTLFFGFSLTLIISCVLLMINCFNTTDDNELEAVSIELSDEKTSSYKDVDKGLSLVVDNLSEPDCDYAYNMLSDENERYLYHKLNKTLYCIDDKKNENGYHKTEYVVISGVEMPETSIKYVLDAFMTDHPEIFWINNTFGYAYDNGNTVVECYSLLTASECETYIERLSEEIDDMIDGIEEIDSDYKKEKFLHDRLLDRCSYAKGVSSVSDGWQYFTAYGAIVDGKAVCEGYSKAFQILLSKAGISAYTVKGYADDIRHMWNVVKIDENWYHVDPTWNDSDDGENYEFFNLSTDEIEKNHKIDSIVEDDTEANRNFFLPECVSMSMNYYNVDGFRIEQFDNETDQDMVAYIANNVDNNNNYLYVTVGNGLDYEECLSTLFDAPNHRIYHYIELANDFLDSSHTIDRTAVKILKNEERRTVRINLKYGN